MKKIKIFSVFVLIICAICFLPACLYSDNATISECYVYYNSMINKYGPKNSEFQTFYNSLSEEYVVSKLTFDYSSNTVLKGEVENVNSDYSILTGELKTLLNNSLYYLYYYQGYLNAFNDNINQNAKSEFYIALEKFEESIKTYSSALNTLKVDLTSQNSAKGGRGYQDLEYCVKNYFKMISSAINVAEKVEKCVLSVEQWQFSKFNKENADSNKTVVINALLSSGLYGTKLLSNYYEQYIEFNGLSKIKEINKLKDVYFDSYYTQIYNKIATISTVAGGINSFSAVSGAENVEKTINKLNILIVSANQMKNINEQLSKDIPTAQSNYDNYLAYQKYNEILTNVNVVGTESAIYYASNI